MAVHGEAVGSGYGRSVGDLRGVTALSPPLCPFGSWRRVATATVVTLHTAFEPGMRS